MPIVYSPGNESTIVQLVCQGYCFDGNEDQMWMDEVGNEGSSGTWSIYNIIVCVERGRGLYCTYIICVSSRLGAEQVGPGHPKFCFCAHALLLLLHGFQHILKKIIIQAPGLEVGH